MLSQHYESLNALRWYQSRHSGSDTETALPGSRVTVTPVLPD
jgi:hypothetical protein